METIFKLFIGTSELMHSPYIAPLGRQADHVLTLERAVRLSLRIPYPGDPRHLEISYNPGMLSISNVKVVPGYLRHGTQLQLTAQGRDLGLTTITIYATARRPAKPAQERRTTSHERSLAPVH